MFIPFRHGLVKTSQPFLEPKITSVDLIVGSDPLVLTISSGIMDFLWIETQTIPNAWVSLVPGQDVWLYWDIDARTALRTFGHTVFEPVVSSVAPISPVVDLHWYDAEEKQMKVWTGVTWQPKYRVFACKLAAGSTPISVSSASPIFTGTQTGDNTQINAGTLLYDASNLPLKSNNGKFLTTEDTLRAQLPSTADVKLASLITEAQAVQNLARYTIVKFSDFGQIVAADVNAAMSTGQFGIIEQDVTTGNLIHVVTNGAITNLNWDWTTIGINAPLYCDNNGALVTSQVIPNQVPVATVIGKHTIQLGSMHFQQTFSTVTNNTYSNSFMTPTSAGIARLNIPAALDLDPIVVGANDPRLTDARVPLPHTHVVSDITNLQSALNLYVPLAGGTMTGSLVLSSDPVAALGAATKQYVDTSVATLSTSTTSGLNGKVSKAGDTMTGALTLSADPATALQAATKQYVDSGVTSAQTTANGKVAKAGDTMTGALLLSGDPTTALQAATKQYVDAKTIGSLVGATGTNGQVLISNGNNTYQWANRQPVVFQLACSDLNTYLVVGTNKGYFHAPFAFTLTNIRASLISASTSGSVTISVTCNGNSLMTTDLVILANSKSSSAASLNPTYVSVPDDAEILINITGAGTTARGLVVTLIGSM